MANQVPFNILWKLLIFWHKLLNFVFTKNSLPCMVCFHNLFYCLGF